MGYHVMCMGLMSQLAGVSSLNAHVLAINVAALATLAHACKICHGGLIHGPLLLICFCTMGPLLVPLDSCRLGYLTCILGPLLVPLEHLSCTMGPLLVPLDTCSISLAPWAHCWSLCTGLQAAMLFSRQGQHLRIWMEKSLQLLMANSPLVFICISWISRHCKIHHLLQLCNLQILHNLSFWPGLWEQILLYP